MKILRSMHIRRVLVPVMAVSLLSACGKWTVQKMAPSQVVTDKEPNLVRLTMLDGDKIQLADPTVSDGEIVAHPVRNDMGYRMVVKSYTVRVATDSVARIEIREPDALATVVGVVLGLAVAAGVAALIFFLTWDGPFGSG